MDCQATPKKEKITFYDALKINVILINILKKLFYIQFRWTIPLKITITWTDCDPTISCLESVRQANISWKSEGMFFEICDPEIEMSCNYNKPDQKFPKCSLYMICIMS